MEPNTQQNTTPEQNPQPQTNQNTNSNPVAPQKEHHVIGPIVGSLIIVILLIIAALYIWTKRVNNEVITPDQNNDASLTETATSPEEAQIINDTGLTDDLVEDLEDINF